MATINDLVYPTDCTSCGPLQERVVDLDQMSVFESLTVTITPMLIPFFAGFVCALIVMMFVADGRTSTGVCGRSSAGIADDPGDF